MRVNRRQRGGSSFVTETWLHRPATAIRLRCPNLSMLIALSMKRTLPTVAFLAMFLKGSAAVLGFVQVEHRCDEIHRYACQGASDSAGVRGSEECGDLPRLLSCLDRDCEATKHCMMGYMQNAC